MTTGERTLTPEQVAEADSLTEDLRRQVYERHGEYAVGFLGAVLAMHPGDENAQVRTHLAQVALEEADEMVAAWNVDRVLWLSAGDALND